MPFFLTGVTEAMTMYEVLISHLRDCAKYDQYENTFSEAADAIEDLQEKLDDARMDASEWAESLEYMSAAKVELEEQTRWIPVTERLPDNIDEEVLVCNEGYGKDGTGFATVAVYNGNGWLECWERKQYLACITHWMPLPEPPKEET